MLIYLAVGGALGTLARYGLSGWVHGMAGARFPWGTLIVNVVGSLLIGFALRYLEGVPVSAELRATITVGALGAFTTFSTYTYETMALLRDGQWLRAAMYSLGSLSIGLVAVAIGLSCAGILLDARG